MLSRMLNKLFRRGETRSETVSIEFANKIMDDRGVYEADLFIAGKNITRKTFFPAHWSRKKVVESIIEAYDDFVLTKKEVPIGLDGKYKIKGFTKENIEIEIFITRECKIVVAYPILRK